MPEIPVGTVPVHWMNPLPESGVAARLTGVSVAYQAVPDTETEPPAPAEMVPRTEVARHCHSSRRNAAGDGWV